VSTKYGNRSCVDPVRLRADCETQGLPVGWWGAANVFRNPLGRGPGEGKILLTKADLDALTLTADASLVFEDDGGRRLTLQKITLLRAKCLTPGHRDDARAVYLCDIADRRHFLAQTPIDRAFNLKNSDGSDYLSGSTNAGTAWTWAEVLSEMWAALDAGAVPTLPFTPDGTPENLRYYGGNAWASLNDVLDRLACAVKYDPVADTFTFVRLGDTAATVAAALTADLAKLDRAGLRSWDTYWREPDRGRLPEKVRVWFPRRPLPTDGSSPYYSVDVTLTATAGVKAGTVVSLRDDLTAVGSGTPTNAAALATRADERAADWRRKRVGFERRLTLVYRDFRAELVPGESVDLSALDDHGGPMQTVLESGPDGRLEEWAAWEPPTTFAADAGCEIYGADTGPTEQTGFSFHPGITTYRPINWPPAGSVYDLLGIGYTGTGVRFTLPEDGLYIVTVWIRMVMNITADGVANYDHEYGGEIAVCAAGGVFGTFNDFLPISRRPHVATWYKYPNPGTTAGDVGSAQWTPSHTFPMQGAAGEDFEIVFRGSVPASAWAGSLSAGYNLARVAPCSTWVATSPPPPPPSPPPPPPPTPPVCCDDTADKEVVIPDGVGAGTYTAAWNAISGWWASGGDTRVRLIKAEGVGAGGIPNCTWFLSLFTTETTYSGTVVLTECPDPFGLSFTGSDFGATTAVTVS
jgi:hypothetical protein